MMNLLRQAALRLLARREHSVHELLRKLLVKGHAKEDIQTVLHTLEEEGLLSNHRFIENYIHYRTSKGFGPLRIREELKERGIPEELIDHHVKITDNAWLTVAKHVWQKRFKNHYPNDYKTRAEHMRFLYYRGFTTEQIHHIINC